MRSMVSRSYGAGIRTMTVSKPSSTYGRSASATSVGDSEEHRSSHVLDPVVRQQRPMRRLGGRPVVAQDDREADGLLDRRDVAPDVGAVLGEDLELAADLLDASRSCSRRRPAAPRSAASSSARTRRRGSADAPGSAAAAHERVMERVEPALVAEPLAIEQAAHQHHRLVEPVEPLADGPSRSRCRRRRARARTRRRRCRARPGRPRGGRGSWRAWRCGPGCGTCWRRPSARGGSATSAGASADSTRPALEDRLLPRPEDRPAGGPTSRPSPSRRPRRRGPRRGSPPSRSAATRAGARTRHRRRGGRGRRRHGTGS